MKWTGLNELREAYLKFFESKNHVRMESASLVPVDDNSLLLINSGMAPLKKYFLNLATPPSKRITTCQKCIRTPDIDNVGKTSRHGTYFEMLGNFSFGDYFKIDSTKWAWEFLTEVLNIPSNRLFVSIYESDDEAFNVWTKEVGISKDIIVRLGKEDNFWEIGSGPCGPCSEIYFDRGEKYGCSSENCAPGCDCDRFMEIWNIVFSQFDSDGKGTYKRMEKPNIDTGMGLERLACIMQDVDNLFEVDTVQNIMSHICKLSNLKYKDNEEKDVSLRVITDHIRSTTFMVADGVMPSNEGRGYVLRRLLRRAARHGRLIGISELFLHKVCETVISENKDAYPELLEKKDYIIKVIKLEEERFSKTIDQGIKMLEEILQDKNTLKSNVLSGEISFKLYDTFGFPIDLTKEIAEEKGLTVDEKVFLSLMKEQREKARNARSNNSLESWSSDNVLNINAKSTEFLGYTTLDTNSRVLAIIKSNELLKSYNGDEEFLLIVDKTPFYAEGGGQCSDIGIIKTSDCTVSVTHCKKNDNGHFIHTCKIVDGTINTDEEVTMSVDKEFRVAVKANHTAAHLLQSALKTVLGEHINQAGQSVDNKRIRFDFTHFSAMTFDEIKKVENLVNEYIFNGVDINAEEMHINDAKKKGAVALFGEKYGEIVRVVSADDSCTIEFCGGTHISNTSKIGLFKILTETSVASGVRRIEAITRRECLAKMNENDEKLLDLAEILKTSTNDIKEKIKGLTLKLKEKEIEIEKLNEKIALNDVKEIYSKKESINENTSYILHFTDNINTNVLKIMGDKLRDMDENLVIILVNKIGEKENILVCCGKNAINNGFFAGDLVREIAKLSNGNGGGKKDSAMAGVKDVGVLKNKNQDILNILKG